VILLDAVYAFFQEQLSCGGLDSAVETEYIWKTCTCGAAISPASTMTD